ncbi:MAG: N,N-dimethylformamidase beta subunit family domain-containing protein [Betaproteobacteria bacterium]|jgi:N,N-dimethylformamidase|nr:LamG domain-containing protein [Rhodocyclaceae bacterium]MCA3136248.1 LamG domain-containing protein [Rhodocyclaceae bacterium]MCA3143886.1 LamG domain-containing protein [Rhodocyclaceae bacterium]MCA3146634.1 LamG domain-containing protein [Rhodocyclaceae bacterium]MCE2899223.1 LamG domain-containing protein [Betaproteobacteria bacterium]
MSRIKIFGYADRISARPGDPIEIMVSAEGTDAVQAQLVRLIHGDENPAGPGFVEREVAWLGNGWHAARKQYAQLGSFLRVPDPEGRLALPGSFTLHAFIHPGLPAAGRQTVMGRWCMETATGYGLGINAEGHAELWIGDGATVDYVAAEVPLFAHCWYFVAATYDASSRMATLYQEAVINRYNSLLGHVAPIDYGSHVSLRLRVQPRHGADIPFLIAGASDRNEARGRFVAQCYNGKIDRCGVHARVLSRAELDALRGGAEPPADAVVARWDTTRGYTDRGIGDLVEDTGPHGLHGRGFNRPVRAMTGWNWNGRDDNFRLAPEQYGGIEFHEDALIDCQWQPTLTAALPEDLRSGVYAVRLRAGEAGNAAEEHVVFFVRPRAPAGRICMLMPTSSYLAYANEHLSFDAPIAQVITAHSIIVAEPDIEMYKNREFGLSTYDLHADGAGVCYSSYRRPIVNMRPRHRMPATGLPWQFPADLSIVYWLEKMGYDYDVLTDEDLHRDGATALQPYRMVINGTHAEYYSERMLDATEDYLARGGRVLYLSGNGYYWVCAYRDEEPWVMEVRKLDSGSRAWQARPGEHYLATTGERSGLWRNRGRPPQKVVGTGFTSEGMDESRPYRRMPDSYHRSVAWIFEGVEGETIGDFGLALGGAAGVEIDRYDLSLGTPPHARILASSEGHSDNYPKVAEEIMYNFPGMGGTQDPQIRADMVYFTTPNHGAVFAPSSIAWGQALPCNDCDNNVSRVMKNVVEAFLKEGPLPGGAWIAEEKHWQ